MSAEAQGAPLDTKELAGQLREIADLIHVGPVTRKITERCRELAGEAAAMNDSPWVARAADVLHDLGWHAVLDQYDRGRPGDAARLRAVADRINAPAVKGERDPDDLLTGEEVLRHARMWTERQPDQSEENYRRAQAARLSRLRDDGLKGRGVAGEYLYRWEDVTYFFDVTLRERSVAKKSLKPESLTKSAKRLSPSKRFDLPPAADSQEGGAA